MSISSSGHIRTPKVIHITKDNNHEKEVQMAKEELRKAVIELEERRILLTKSNNLITALKEDLERHSRSNAISRQIMSKALSEWRVDEQSSSESDADGETEMTLEEYTRSFVKLASEKMSREHEQSMNQLRRQLLSSEKEREEERRQGKLKLIENQSMLARLEAEVKELKRQKDRDIEMRASRGTQEVAKAAHAEAQVSKAIHAMRAIQNRVDELAAREARIQKRLAYFASTNANAVTTAAEEHHRRCKAETSLIRATAKFNSESYSHIGQLSDAFDEVIELRKYVASLPLTVSAATALPSLAAPLAIRKRKS